MRITREKIRQIINEELKNFAAPINEARNSDLEIAERHEQYYKLSIRISNLYNNIDNAESMIKQIKNEIDELSYGADQAGEEGELEKARRMMKQAHDGVLTSLVPLENAAEVINLLRLEYSKIMDSIEDSDPNAYNELY